MEESNRPPEQAPGETGQQPGSEGTPRLFAGKYKTVEDMEKAYSESQAELNRVNEAKQRLESLAFAPPAPDQYGIPGQVPPAYVPPEVGYVPPVDSGEFISRAEAQRIAQESANAQIREWQRVQETQVRLSAEQEYWKAEFYRRHTDLKDDEPIVRGVTADVLQRYSHLPQQQLRAYLPSILDEVAVKAREKKAAYIQQGKSEAAKAAQAQTEGQVPGSSGPVNPPVPPPKESPDEIQAEMRQKAQARYNASRVPPPR